MTLADMRRNIRYGLGLNEPEEVPIIDQKIHDGINDVLRRTGCTVLCFDADTPDNSARLELGGAIMRVQHVTRNEVRLERVSFPSLDRYTNAYAQVGNVLIFSEAFSPTEKLQLYAVPRAAKMTNPTDTLETPGFGGIPEEFQDAVQLYALAELGNLANDEASQRGGTYRVMYEGQSGREGRLAEIRRLVNKMSGTTIGPATLDYCPVGMPR
jgi:hypothetical protein